MRRRTGSTANRAHDLLVAPHFSRRNGRCAEGTFGWSTIWQARFRLIVDLTELESMEVTGSALIANIMESRNAAGVAKVLRKISDRLAISACKPCHSFTIVSAAPSKGAALLSTCGYVAVSLRFEPNTLPVRAAASEISRGMPPYPAGLASKNLSESFRTSRPLLSLKAPGHCGHSSAFSHRLRALV